MDSAHMPNSIKKQWLPQGLLEKGWESLPRLYGKKCHDWLVMSTCVMIWHPDPGCSVMWVPGWLRSVATTPGCWGPRRSETQSWEITVVRRMTLTGTRKHYDLIRSKICTQRPRNKGNCEETLTQVHPWTRTQLNKINFTQLRLQNILKFKKASN